MLRNNKPSAFYDVERLIKNLEEWQRDNKEKNEIANTELYFALREARTFP